MTYIDNQVLQRWLVAPLPSLSEDTPQDYGASLGLRFLVSAGWSLQPGRMLHQLLMTRIENLPLQLVQRPPLAAAEEEASRKHAAGHVAFEDRLEGKRTGGEMRIPTNTHDVGHGLRISGKLQVQPHVEETSSPPEYRGSGKWCVGDGDLPPTTNHVNLDRYRKLRNVQVGRCNHFAVPWETERPSPQTRIL